MGAQKGKAQAESTELSRQLEEIEGQISQLSKAKQTLSKQLEEAKAALEEEAKIKSKLNGDNRNLQVNE
jgi:chaperonin cofactor prefoldin